MGKLDFIKYAFKSNLSNSTNSFLKANTNQTKNNHQTEVINDMKHMKKIEGQTISLSKKQRGINSQSHTLRSETSFGNWNDEKNAFYFNFKTHFHSKEIYIFILAFWTFRGTTWLERKG